MRLPKKPRPPWKSPRPPCTAGRSSGTVSTCVRPSRGVRPKSSSRASSSWKPAWSVWPIVNGAWPKNVICCRRILKMRRCSNSASNSPPAKRPSKTCRPVKKRKSSGLNSCARSCNRPCTTSSRPRVTCNASTAGWLRWRPCSRRRWIRAPVLPSGCANSNWPSARAWPKA
ncbi:hypothetical protein D3C78_1277300 [compost metagenome]